MSPVCETFKNRLRGENVIPTNLMYELLLISLDPTSVNNMSSIDDQQFMTFSHPVRHALKKTTFLPVKSAHFKGLKKFLFF
jgi:hypothetical protein